MPRYPDIEPYETGLLDTGDGNLVYWETCGNPDGVPALIVHGGPGSGCSARSRTTFDPEKFRIILFDQRNAHRSRPHASDPAADMSLNTTEYLLRDMEQLREHLGVEKWLLREKNFKPMPDRLGWFLWLDNNNLYIEVLSWDKVLKDAKMRNQIFFHKLGI